MSSAVAKAPTRIDVERLTSLGERFRIWQRRQGKSYFKMPSCLWDEAFRFVPLFGATRVAREIGLSRDELLRRMNEEQEPIIASVPASMPARDTSEATEFLEIEWPGVAMASTPSRPAAAAIQIPAPPISCEPERSAPSPAVAAPASDSTSLRTEEAWLEVVAPDGAKLTLRIPVSHLMNASALVREFRGQR